VPVLRVTLEDQRERLRDLLDGLVELGLGRVLGLHLGHQLCDVLTFVHEVPLACGRRAHPRRTGDHGPAWGHDTGTPGAGCHEQLALPGAAFRGEGWQTHRMRQKIRCVLILRRARAVP
jgi:hypothetical protein